MSMRHYINLIEGREVILEAQDYNAMFNGFLSLSDKSVDTIMATYADDPDHNAQSFEQQKQALRTEINSKIQWAKLHLKKNDRIVWFLKMFRYALVERSKEFYSDNAQIKPNFQMLSTKYWTDLSQGSSDQFAPSYFDLVGRGFASFERTLEHLISLPIAKIQNTVFGKQSPNALIGTFKEYEDEWKEEQRTTFDYDDEQIIMEFPDGMMWVNLQRASCDRESRAMGHCGNSPRARTDDQILSLRKIVQKGEKRFWQPFLTFILEDHANLTESKGRGNQKPAERYHPYIVELLKLPLIKKIVGGGYMPENNFKVSDLADNLRDDLLDTRPDLADAITYYRKNGVDEILKEKILNELSKFDDSIHLVGDQYVIARSPDWLEFIDNYGGRDAKNYIKYLNGDEYWDWEVDKSDVESLFGDLPTASQEAIRQHVIDTYNPKPEGYDPEFDDEDDPEEFDATDDSEIIRVLEDEGDEIYDSLRRGVDTAKTHGAEKELLNLYERAFDDFEKEIDPVEIYFGNDKKFAYDIAVSAILSIESALKVLADDNFLENIGYSGWFGENEIEISTPYYGFTDMDDDAGVDDFLEQEHAYDFRPPVGAPVSKMSREEMIAELTELAPQMFKGRYKPEEHLALYLEALPTKPDEGLISDLEETRRKIRNQ